MVSLHSPSRSTGRGLNEARPTMVCGQSEGQNSNKAPTALSKASSLANIVSKATCDQAHLIGARSSEMLQR